MGTVTGSKSSGTQQVTQSQSRLSHRRDVSFSVLGLQSVFWECQALWRGEVMHLNGRQKEE